MAEKQEYDFTLGADPEFCCVEGKTLIESSAFTNEYDQFGSDGNGVTFEVRPDATPNPLELVANIHDIFARKIHTKKEFLKFDWKAGSHYADCPLGGHIHFGIKSQKLARTTAGNILDNYVGAITVLLEHREQGLRRRSGNYGHINDTRAQAWGFEYRTTASWITSPYVSAAILCLAKTVLYEVCNNPNFEPRQLIREEDFDNMDTERIMEFFPQIWKDIIQMKLYQQYKPYIDLIYRLVNKSLTWFPNTNMKEAWGLLDLELAYDMIQMNTIWQPYKHQMDLNGNGRIRVARAVEPVTIYQ